MYAQQMARQTRVRRTLARACSTFCCSFHGSTFCLNGYDRTFHHTEESLLNTFPAYITGTVSAITASSRDFVDFINVDNAHTMIT